MIVALACRTVGTKPLWRLWLAAGMIMIALLATPILAHGAPLTTCTWTGSTNTDWNTDTNWSCSAVPGAGDSVIVPNAGNDPVIASGITAEVLDLTVNSGGYLTLNGALTINHNLTLNGTIYGTGSLDVPASGTGQVTWYASTLTGPTTGALTVAIGRPILFDGGERNIQYSTVAIGAGVPATWRAGNIALQNATINNAGSWDMQGDLTLSFASEPGTFNNLPGAQITKSAGTGDGRLLAYFDNDGTVAVQAGQLLLGGRKTVDPSDTSTGDFVVQAGATLSFGRQSPYANGQLITGSISGAGAVLFATTHGGSATTYTISGLYNITGATQAGVDGVACSPIVVLNNIQSLGNLTLECDANVILTPQPGQTSFTQNYNVTLRQPDWEALTINFPEFIVTGTHSQLWGTLKLNSDGAVYRVDGPTQWNGGIIKGLSGGNVEKFIAMNNVAIQGPAPFNGYLELWYASFENHATATWSGGTIELTSATIDNLVGATWDIRTDGDIRIEFGTVGSAFNNRGLVKKTAGDSTFVESTSVACAFNNIGPGVTQAQAGWLWLNGGGNSDAPFEVAAGAQLGLGGAHTISGTISGAGHVRFGNSGTQTVTGAYTIADVAGSPGTAATAVVESAVTTLSNIVSLGDLSVLTSGKLTLVAQPGQTSFSHGYNVTLNGFGACTLEVKFQQFTVTRDHTQTGCTFKGSMQDALSPSPATYTVEGTTFWHSGSIEGQTGSFVESFVAHGQLRITGTGAAHYLRYRTLTNTTYAYWMNGNLSLKDAIVDNLAGATWEVQTDADMPRESGDSGTISRVNNLGTFNKTIGDITSGLFTQVDAPFHSTLPGGSAAVQQGELYLSRGGTSDAPFTVAAGTRLSLGGTTHNISGSVTGQGEVRFYTGTENITGNYNISGANGKTSVYDSAVATLSDITSLGELVVGQLGASDSPKLTLKPQVGQTTFTHNYGVTMDAGGSGYLDIQFQQFTTKGNHWQQSGTFQGWVTGQNAIYEIEGTTTWKGGTILGDNTGGTGVEWFIAKGPLNIDAANSASKLHFRTLKNLQNTNWSSGNIELRVGTIMNGEAGNYASAAWIVDLNYDILRYSSSTGLFENYGLFQKKTGTTGADTKVDVTFNTQSSGAVEVKASELWLSEGGTSNGPLSVDADAKLSFSYNHTINGGVSGGGEVSFRNDGSQTGTSTANGVYNIAGAGSSTTVAGGSTVTMNNVTSLGSLTVQDTAKLTLDPKAGQASLTHAYNVVLSSSQFLAVNIPNFIVTGNHTQSAGTFKGAAASGDTLYEVQGTTTWTGGAIQGTTGGATEIFRTKGTFNIQGPSSGTLTIMDRTLETRSGTAEAPSSVIWTDGTIQLNIAPIINAAGVTWDVQTDADITRATPASDSTSRFDNYGTFKKTLSTAPAYTIVGAKFTNFGGALLHTQAGKLVITELVNSALGAVVIDQGTTLAVDGAVTNSGSIQQTRDVGAGEFVRIRNDAGNSTKYLGVTIASGDLGSGTRVTIWGNQHCGTALGINTSHVAEMVLRCFEIVPAAVATTDITFHYLASEANLNEDPEVNHYIQNPNPDWALETRTSQNNSDAMRWVAVTGVDEYSTATTPYFPFGLADGDPLAVTLASFSSEALTDHVLVTWETVSELNTLGFNLWRGASETGPDVQLNDTLIPSQAAGAPSGFSYIWEDRQNLTPGATTYYWLEDVDVDGTVTRHGPVSATSQAPTAVELTYMEASASPAPLSGLWVWVAMPAVLVGTAVASRRLARLHK